MINIAIAGSRSITDADYVKQCLVEGIKLILDMQGINKEFCKTWGDRPRDYIKLILGGAKGVDTLASDFAEKYSIQKQILPADWSKGKSAGMKRNIEMANISDALIAIWDGVSAGTKHMIDYCNKRVLVSENGLNYKMTIVTYEGVYV
jgi:hypothetical protein